MFRLLLLLILGTAAYGLEVKQTRWGFNGKVVQGRFNLLSVLVVENGPKAFDGALRLDQTRGGVRYGAEYVQPIYVAPGTSRWVQFVVLHLTVEPWQISWGRTKDEQMELDPPAFGPPAQVALSDPTATTPGSIRMKQFPDDLFPASVSAMDGLDQLVLDHVPRWEAARREALLDWVRRGGVVHLIRGPLGVPTFTGDLAPLSAGKERNASGAVQHRIGAGTVVRHEVAAVDCTPEYFAEAGYPERVIAPGSQTYEAHRFDQSLLQNLAGITKPEVQWWLLYLLTLAYIIAIGPVHYIWSRGIDYRLSILGFVGIVGGFAFAFVVAGHRGSGEKQTSHAVAIARSLGGDRWDVTQWVSAFATRGDVYRLSHGSPFNYYALPADSERVDGRCFGGRDGHIEVEIPLYSARPLMQRGVFRGPGTETSVVVWKPDHLKFELPASFSKEPQKAVIYWRREFLQAVVSGRSVEWRGSGSLRKSREEYFAATNLSALQSYQWQMQRFRPAETFVALVGRALGDVPCYEYPWAERPLPVDRAQLFVLADAPESQAMQGKGFSTANGLTLYVYDVSAPSSERP